MRILGLVDLHWRGPGPASLPDLVDCDLLLLGGDLTHMGGRDLARQLLSPLLEQGTPFLAVCGNCDHPEIEEVLAQEDRGLDRRVRVVQGVRLMGLSGGLPFDGCPYERSEEDFRRCTRELSRGLKEVGAGPSILVSHQPPFGTTCDRLRDGRHVGSRAIRRFIEESQPDLVLCGHIHESLGQDQIGRTRIVNPGAAFLRRGVEIQVADGALVQVQTF